MQVPCQAATPPKAYLHGRTGWPSRDFCHNVSAGGFYRGRTLQSPAAGLRKPGENNLLSCSSFVLAGLEVRLPDSGESGHDKGPPHLRLCKPGSHVDLTPMPLRVRSLLGCLLQLG